MSTEELRKCRFCPRVLNTTEYQPTCGSCEAQGKGKWLGTLVILCVILGFDEFLTILSNPMLLLCVVALALGGFAYYKFK